MSEQQRGLVYLITGGCGFLGQHILRLLLEKEPNLSEVRVFDKHTDPSLTQLGSERTKVTVIQGDITDLDNVRDVTNGADLVIHAASLVDVWHRVPESVIEAVNVTGTEHVISACVENNIQHLVYTSSMEVIGPNMDREPFLRGNEETQYKIKHTMPYPKSKAKAEKIVLQANGIKLRNGKSLGTCALRPTGIYGEGHQLMKDFYSQCVQRGGVLVGGVPDSTEHGRVYAGNVAWMHILAARALMDRPESVAGEAFFCYDDSPYLSYENFNMILLSAFKFRKLSLPAVLLWFIAILNDVLRWTLSPFYNFSPLLNHYTLAVAITTFTVQTDKALRHFQYRPLYDWEECRDRTQKWINTFPKDK